MAPRALFIDIDGVLLPGPPPLAELMDPATRATYLERATTRDPATLRWLPVLVELLAPHPDVHVIVHSSRRLATPRIQLIAELGDLACGRVVDVTGGDDAYGSILDAVKTYGIIDYRILDDDAGRFPVGCTELIRCSPETGITDPAVQEQLQVWLGRQ